MSNLRTCILNVYDEDAEVCPTEIQSQELADLVSWRQIPDVGGETFDGSLAVTLLVKPLVINLSFNFERMGKLNHV